MSFKYAQTVALTCPPDTILLACGAHHSPHRVRMRRAEQGVLPDGGCIASAARAAVRDYLLENVSSLPTRTRCLPVSIDNICDASVRSMLQCLYLRPIVSKVSDM